MSVSRDEVAAWSQAVNQFLADAPALEVSEDTILGLHEPAQTQFVAGTTESFDDWKPQKTLRQTTVSVMS